MKSVRISPWLFSGGQPVGGRQKAIDNKQIKIRLFITATGSSLPLDNNNNLAPDWLVQEVLDKFTDRTAPGILEFFCEFA